MLNIFPYTEMDKLKKTSEIVEVREELDPGLRLNNESANNYCSDSRKRYSIEDDINRLFQALDSRNTRQKSAQKRPIRVGIGIAEPVSLKQALRGLCISQAAEMAAMKRLSRPAQSLGVSEAVTIKRLNRASLNESIGKMVEVSIIPERIESKISNEVVESMQKSKSELVNPSDYSFTTLVDPIMEEIVESGLSLENSHGRAISKESSSNDRTASDENSSCLNDFSSKASMQRRKIGVCKSAPSHSSSIGNSPRLIKPIFRAKSSVKKKSKLELTKFPANSENDKVPKTEIEKKMNDFASAHEMKGNTKALNVISLGVEQSTLATDSTTLTRSLETISEGRSRFREKGEFTQSSKSSLADCSYSPSISGQSIGSGSRNNRPHMSKDLRWEAINQVHNQHKSLGLSNFKMLRKLGLGDIGTVYLAELNDTNCLFAVKVMDKDLLRNRKKIIRAQTEKEILHMLDHPFLPTLYAHFETHNFMYFVIDYCQRGDLHVLRQKQPSKNFSERAVRFYGAEVLLALEYLHMLGVVYRDLKPENILIREDGHIMLTDFDLSLRCHVNTKVLKPSSLITEPPKKVSNPRYNNGCIHPLCLHTSWEVPCFTPKHSSSPSKSRTIKTDLVGQVIVEPIGARSNSFVGTHEYLAPEIVKAEGHGNAVDWWTYGVFLFELLYGKTPFKGSSNEETLTNIVSKSLALPEIPIVSFHARDLIRRLLIKEPENRMGSTKGAAEIKQHPFFDGLNWALIRSTSPPESTRVFDPVIWVGCNDDSSKRESSESSKHEVNENRGEVDAEFELF